MKNSYLKSLNRISAFLFILIACSADLFGQPQLPSQIDLALRKNARVVIQNYDVVVEIESKKKAIINEITTATIFNDDTDYDQLFTRFVSDDHLKILSLNIKLYNEWGKMVKKIKKSDFNDVAYFDGISVHTDNRVLTYDVHELRPPYTMVVEYTAELRQLMSIPDWKPVSKENISLDQSSLTIVHSGDLKINHFEQEVNPPEVKSINNSIKYTWKRENFLALPKVSMYDAPLSQVVPIIKWTSSKFDFGGVEGGCDTWGKFGDWFYKLGQESQDLPQSAIDEVSELIQSSMSKKERTKVIYNFLQDRSRYVSIQLGIGG